MSNCSNCFNGCTEIVSDKCVKYTGVNIDALGISNGDTLSYVEERITSTLLNVINATGIYPNISPEIICEFVSNYLEVPDAPNAKDIFTALIKAACDLQEQVDALVVKFDELEQPYTTGCLDGIEDNTNTHEVLQAVIVKLCQLGVDVEALALTLDTEYVKLDELNELIQAYLDSQGTSSKIYNRMVPYTAVEYYGTLDNFSGSGVGLGDWEQIYLCNGANGTPDKRGRSPIGVLDMPGGGALSPIVNPSAGNFNYTLSSINGVNSVVLSPSQMPIHTHTATVSINDPGHAHAASTPIVVSRNEGSATSGDDLAHQSPQDNRYTKTYTTNVANGTTGLNGTNVSVSNANAGANAPHNNVHPVIACYYIMYIPNP